MKGRPCAKLCFLLWSSGEGEEEASNMIGKGTSFSKYFYLNDQFFLKKEEEKWKRFTATVGYKLRGDYGSWRCEMIL